MEYRLVYEFIPHFNKITHLFPLLLIVSFSIISVLLIRKYRTVNQYIKKTSLGIMYLLGIITFIMIITMLINIPKILSQERLIKECVYNNDCNKIEGIVTNFRIDTINGNYIESFHIKDVKFEYSDNVSFYGYNCTSNNNGLIKGNGLNLRISYVTINNKNLILKIEEIHFRKKNM